MVRGYIAEIDSAETYDLSALGTAPVSGETRVDRVVCRLDRSAGQVSVEVITGTPATTGSEVAPAITQDATSWDVKLAQVRWTFGSAVAQADITDERVAAPNTAGFGISAVTWLQSDASGGWPAARPVPDDSPIVFLVHPDAALTTDAPAWANNTIDFLSREDDDS